MVKWSCDCHSGTKVLSECECNILNYVIRFAFSLVVRKVRVNETRLSADQVAIVCLLLNAILESAST